VPPLLDDRLPKPIQEINVEQKDFGVNVGDFVVASWKLLRQVQSNDWHLSDSLPRSSLMFVQTVGIVVEVGPDRITLAQSLADSTLVYGLFAIEKKDIVGILGLAPVPEQKQGQKDPDA
jgi:hypothetical protein